MTQNIEVIGTDVEGNRYRLNIQAIIEQEWGNTKIIEVELPFSPAHRIWEELRRNDTNTGNGEVG